MDTIEQELKEIADKGRKEVRAYAKELEEQGLEKKEIAEKLLKKYGMFDIWFYFQFLEQEC